MSYAMRTDLGTQIEADIIVLELTCFFVLRRVFAHAICLGFAPAICNMLESFCKAFD